MYSFKQMLFRASVSLSTLNMSHCPSLAVAAQLVHGAGRIVVTYVCILLLAYKRSRRGDFSFCKKDDLHKGLLNLNPHISEDCIPLLIDMEDSSPKISCHVLNIFIFWKRLEKMDLH